MAGDDPLFAAWIREQDCAMHHFEKCSGAVQAHHSNVHRKGLGLRASDRTCVPLCAKHHREWHDINGDFAGLTRPMRVAWTDRMMDFYNGRYPAPKFAETPDCDDIF